MVQIWHFQRAIEQVCEFSLVQDVNINTQAFV